MQRQRRFVFPLGLYGVLLFALCWLTLPTVFRPLERVLVGFACQAPRLVSSWLGQPVAAATAAAATGPAAAVELTARVQAHAIAGARAVLPSSLRPRVAAVVAVGRRLGGGGRPCELLLDLSYAELAAAAPWVTKGDVLLGSLARPGSAAAPDDRAEDPARVVLTNHPLAQGNYAAVSLAEGGSLRLVVRAAATFDPAALRVELWDNPYRAARLDTGGQRVWTLALPDTAGAAPAGLWLGRTRIWGYEAAEREETLAIGVFVAPPFDATALSHVVVWEPEVAAEAPAPRPVQRIPARVVELPGNDRGRHLVDAGASLPDGAAVVQGELCLGTVHGLAFGIGLMTAFPASRQPWNLLLLPDDTEARPRELRGTVVQRDGEVVWLRCRGDELDEAGAALPAGRLFTGSNGRHCPAGLLLGSVRPHGVERDLLEFRSPVGPGPHAAEVLVGAGT
jgi:hypothetical protein